MIICWLSPPQGIGLTLKFETETGEAWHSGVRVWCRLKCMGWWCTLVLLLCPSCLVRVYMLSCSRCKLRRTCEQCNKSNNKKKAIATRGSDKKIEYTRIVSTSNNKDFNRMKDLVIWCRANDDNYYYTHIYWVEWNTNNNNNIELLCGADGWG